MERLVTPVGILIALSLVAYGVVTYFDNPMDDRRAVLESALAKIEPEEEIWDTTVRTNFSELRRNISGNRRLWGELILPPPKPPPPKRTLDLAKKLAGVMPTRQSFGIGDTLKVKIVAPAAPKGAFYGVGDKVSGVKIFAITKDSIKFSQWFEGKEYKHSIPRP